MSVRLLHVVATGQRRGAEMFASDLVGALAEIGRFEQEVVMLHGPWPSAVAYAAPVSPLRSGGRRLPGLRVDIATLRSLRAAVRRFEPDIVHAHGGEAFKHAAIATGGRARLLYRRIGTAPPEIRRGPRRTVHAALLRRSDRIVAVAETVRRETVEVFGIRGDRVLAIPRGIDARRLRSERGRVGLRAELGIPSSAPVVLALGALSEEKDPLAHLDLCETVSRSFPDVVHVFAGDGPMRRALEDAVAARGLRERVRVLGSRNDVGDLLDASDLMVLASRTEGMPGCVIEAGMSGLATVAFGVGGVSEAIADEETGYVVPPGDHLALANRVLELLKDDERRESMGRAASERCRAMFDIASVARRYADVYADVAAS